MLFLLFVIALITGIVCIMLGDWICMHTEYDTEWLKYIGVFVVIIAIIAILISGCFMLDTYTDIEATVNKCNQRYESLVYQLENNLYDNDNDLGKKQLYNEITEWNEDLAYYKSVQDSFWLGIFYPDVFDQFEFIKYGD